ncbi:hypothetical protein HNQ02_000821 [Flavobacterium sp. 7E]|uniref:DUF4175 family protein n=1 Tax=Flavobacterium sp. 7E TaxID=2735898 RepID=UPI00156E04EC|nr:DUF4175 family protein [Flavobacterium sp. 7E]NRS87911.1 hypothetical protein [Flavobacterium sp. 7E]
MERSNFIYQKLEAFIRKFYWNELIRGIIFFIGLGLLYFLFTLFVEYFLWLQPMARTLLFWTFIIVEAFLLLRFILFPVFKLFKLQKGLSYNDASKIIGNHFNDVQDTLTNFLQLSAGSVSHEKSELLVASINQKANALQPIPFGNAINLNTNKKYLPLAIIPILLFAVFFLTGNKAIISQSLNRVVHFNTAFSPPAPFSFVVLNNNLQTEQNKDFIIRVKTIGNVVPENVMIFINNESYFLENTIAGEYQFKITNPSSSVSFHLEANKVYSKDYELKVVQVPAIADFEMLLNFPSYLYRKSEIIKGTGNAVIPEGTRVTWKIKTQATQNVVWSSDHNDSKFNKSENSFVLNKNVFQNTDYQIITSNYKVKNYEKLNYQLTVIKDQFPSIQVSTAPDSLKVDKSFVLGQISDDYGISKLQIVYYPKSKPTSVKRGTINSGSGSVAQFVFSFPSNLSIEQGVVYDYYFEVFDNDVLHSFKSTKSTVFSSRILTDTEKQDEILQEQNDNIKGLENSLNKQNKQIAELDKLQKSGKEKDKFEFKEQQEVKDFIKRQKQQDDLMKQFSDKMKENLDQFKSDKNDVLKEALQKRLDNSNKDLEENNRLLEELKDLNDKIKNDELLTKLDKFKQNSKNQVKNLKQLVELTKKYYVEKKAEQIADKLNKLADKQDKLAEENDKNTVEKQAEINKGFDKIQEELKDLKKDNEELKAPADLPNDVEKEKSIDDDLKNAVEELQKDNKSKAKPKQKNAAKSMKSMSSKMSQSLAEGSKEQMEEDVKMLRQVLDNLLAFSMSQEELMNQFKNIKSGSAAVSKNIKWQQDLKQQFKHIDDSLFAMSLRNPQIAEQVTKEIGNMQYNIDKSLDSFTETQFSKGLSHQQYTIAAANKLGDFLSNVLSNLQSSLSNPGSGKPKPGEGSGMQLPDIIKRQESLGDKIKKGMESGKDPGDKNSGNSKDGNGGEDGEGNAKAILEIYKQQQQLRESLENELKKQGLSREGLNALEQMKQLEKQLLNKGFKNETLQKAVNIKQELLKLETAIKEQGEDNKRQSESNKKQFTNDSKPLPKALLDYLNSIEILNRQSLPLRSNFNQKVQEYFNKK